MLLRLGISALFLSACSLDASALPGASSDASDAAVDGADTRPPDDTTPPPDTGDTGLPSDTGAPDADAGSALTNYYDVAWGPGVPVRELHQMGSCETDPVLTPDERWLFISRPEGGASSGCYDDRRFLVYEWNDGAPALVGKLELFDSRATEESNAHPLDGALFGRPEWTLMIYVSGSIGRGRRLAYGWLSPSPVGAPVMTESWDYVGINGYSPSLTNDGTRLIYGGGSDLYESVGSAPTGFVAGSQLFPGGLGESDSALSPDGRVVVIGRDEGSGLFLYVARRREVDQPFEADVRLPVDINTPGGATDAFITTSGDLLYTTADAGGAQRVYIARRVTP